MKNLISWIKPSLKAIFPYIYPEINNFLMKSQFILFFIIDLIVDISQ